MGESNTLGSHGASPRIRVALVDDHELVRSGLRMLIESKPELVVVGEAANVADALAAAAREDPDVIVLDLDLAGESALESVGALRRASERARVLVLTGLSDPAIHEQAVRVGAMGVVTKDKAPDVLLKAIHCVHAGQMWLDHSLTARLFAQLQAPGRRPTSANDTARIAQLTAREREVVALVAEGLRNKQIAQRLRISEATVRHHLTSIFEKLQVSDRLGLTIFAFRHGLGSLLS